MRTAPGMLALALLLAAWPAPAQEPDEAPSGEKVPARIRVHRVDDFVTREDLRAGLALADRDAPIVTFPHTAHVQLGLSCEQCHHMGVEEDARRGGAPVEGGEASACATCHKGAPAVDTMHRACFGCHAGSDTGSVSCNLCHTARQASFAGIVRFELYDIVRGPLFIAAWALFALGFAWRIFQFTRVTRVTRSGRRTIAVPLPLPSADDREFLSRGRSWIGRSLSAVRRWLRRTIFGTTPVMGVVSLLFHVALFLAPLLLPAHNILFFQTFRVSLPTLPEPLLDKATLGLMAVGGFFLMRRMFLPRVRALTTVRDYLILLLVAAPFVTAYLAYHQVLDYRTILVTHMIIGEILIAAIPFTKLGHMPFIIFARFFVAGEYAWKPGNRRW